MSSDFGKLEVNRHLISGEDCAIAGEATAVAAAAAASLAKPAPQQRPLEAPPSGLGAHRRQVMRYLLPSLPSAFYFSIQGPLVVWLSATFGSTENIAERLALRNYLDELRGTGERTGGPAALDNTDRKRFADQLDRFLTKVTPP